jgi:glycosyltransferase involved in cell wall biosynthesis
MRRNTMTGACIVSVIVPAFNAEEYLGQCLGSIRNQTLDNIEIIIVDDGSTDTTLELAHSLQREDSRIKVLTQKNSYAGVARNVGMREAHGTYLSFLDADDFFEPTMLEKMVADAERHNSDIVICRPALFSAKDEQPLPRVDATPCLEPGRVYSSDDLIDHIFTCTVGWAWDKLFRRSFIEETKLTFQNLRSTNDAYFVYCSLMLARRVTLVDEYLAYHRIGNINSIENARGTSWENAFIAIEAIEEKLHEEGLFERYEKPFLRWVFTFGLWNIETLEGAAKEGVWQRFQHDWIPRLITITTDPFVEPFVLDYLEMMQKTHADLLQEHIKLHWELKKLFSQNELLREQNELLRKQNDGLSEKIESVTTALEQTILEYEHSTSYRLGRTLTYLPRIARGRLQRSL